MHCHSEGVQIIPGRLKNPISVSIETRSRKLMFFTIIQIIVSVLLVVVILLQVQGGGLSPVFGGGGEMYRSRRNVERFLVIATAVLATILAVLSLILLIPR